MKGLRLVPVLLILVMSIAYADLGDFPEQFMDGDDFNGIIVIGEDGSARDYVSGLELAIGLQSRLGDDMVCTVEEETDNSEVFQIKKPENMLESSEPMSNVIETITENEFSLLASDQVRTERGTFAYEQFINLGPSGYTTFDYEDDIPNDPEDIPKSVMVFNDTIYEYQLVFSTSLESEIDTSANSYVLKDLEDKKIDILGNEYTIISTTHESKDSVAIDLLGGSLEDTMQEYQTKTYDMDGVSYEIKVIAVTYTNDKLKTMLEVNGERTDNLEVGETYTLSDGTEVGIKELLENEGQEAAGGDLVTFYIGAKKITLADSNITDDSYDGEYQIDDDDVEDTAVKITGIDPGLSEGEIFKIESISVKFTPTDVHYLADDVHLSEIIEEKGQLFTSSFDISFEGFDESAYDLQEVSLEPVGDDEYVLKFKNKLDQDLEVPLFYQTLDRLGDTEDTLHVVEGVPITTDDYFIVTSDGHAGVPDADGYTHLVRYEGQNSESDYLEFTDMATGEAIEVAYDDGATSAKRILKNIAYAVQIHDTSGDQPTTVDLSLQARRRSFARNQDMT